MKKSIPFVLLLMVVFASSSAVFAGNETATINEHFQITLPADKPLAASYTIDISKLPFKDAIEAQTFFDGAKDAGVSFVLDYQNKMVTLNMAPVGHMEAWTVADWNKYFEVRAVKLELYDKSIQTR